LNEDARSALEVHVAKLEAEAKVLETPRRPGRRPLFAPTLAEIPDAAFLPKEVFGPILHVVRYDPMRLAEAPGPGPGPLRPHARRPQPHRGLAAEVQRAVPAGNATSPLDIGAVGGVSRFGRRAPLGTGPRPAARTPCCASAVERAVSVNIAARAAIRRC